MSSSGESASRRRFIQHVTMNSKTLLPVAAALGGFLLGWVVKPAAMSETDRQAAAGTEGSPAPGKETDNPRNGRPVRPSLSKRTSASPTAPTENAVQLQQRLDNAFRSAGSARDRARLVRLSEALGLSSEQLDQFDALLTEQRQQAAQPPSGLSPKDTLDQMAASAKAFDAKFRAMLGPEQSAALETLRARQAENRAEARAQRDLADLIVRVDVSPEQREAVAEVMRAAAVNEQARMPDGAGLLMESSFLTNGSSAMSEQAIEAMMALGEDANASKDPLAVGRRMEDLQRNKILARSAALEGILTPAQLAQYRVAAETPNTFVAPPPKH